MTTFLLKTEPGVYSFADLARDKRTVWDGVSNNAALVHIRAVRRGDQAFIYHTGDERRVVGLAKIVSDSYEDPKNPGLNSAGLAKLAVFDLAPVAPAATPVTLEAMKSDRRFEGFDLLRLPRLSVMPVPQPFDRFLRELAGLPAR